MIRFDDIHLTYRSGDADVRALHGVDLELRDGELLVVLGANGSGKSTLTRLADGLLLPDRGSVLVDGVDTADPARTFSVRSVVGLVFQNPDDQIVATSVAEEVAFGPENLGLPRAELKERVAWALDAVGLRGFDDREPHALSGGQKQRLAIAGALAMRPRHLVLDEPTSMLDPDGRRDVLAVLHRMRDEGVAVMMVTHRVEDAAAADAVAVLNGGSVAWEGRFSELVGRADSFAGWGLSLPSVTLLAAELRARGVAVPADAVHADELVSALCR